MSNTIIRNLCLIFILIFVGCGLKEGVVNKEPESYLVFKGNTRNATAYIDDLAPIDLSKPLNINPNTGEPDKNSYKGTGEIHYQLSPGKHTIVIKREGKQIVNRVILLGNGITKEIQVP
jgi:hypothetical protein